MTFHGAETGFCVLRVKARGHRDLITIVGHAATIFAGELIAASGDWVNDRIHSQQFKVCFLPARQAERGQLAGKRGSCRPDAVVRSPGLSPRKQTFPLC